MTEIIVIDRIRLRGVAHRKQTKIAEAMGSHPSTITRKMQGDIPLTLRDINTIAKVCGVKPSAFVMFIDEADKQEGYEDMREAIAA